MRKLLFYCSLLFLIISCQEKEDDGNFIDTADTESPTLPQGLSSSNTTTSSTELSWSSSSDNVSVTGYKVYQDNVEIIEVTGTSYTVTGLSASTTYTFSVSAIDGSGNESVQSTGLDVTTGTASDTEPPSVPQGLSSSNITTSGTDLSWTASTDNVGVTGYKVYRDGSEVATVTGTTYTVTGLSSGTMYAFSVSAIDGSGNESAQSSGLNVLTNTSSSVSKVLVFTKTAGFNHNTKSQSVSMVEQIGNSLGFEVTVDDTGSEFDSTSNLAEYEIIFFTNTSGNTLTSTQRGNVESYAAQGGHFISNHAASDGYAHSTASTVSGGGKGVWDWYSENVTGCSVRNNPNHTASNFSATVSIENPNNELTSGISFPWNDNEEWYYWEGGYIDGSFTELLRVSDTGSNPYDDARMTSQYWVRPVGGRSFYTSMGHSTNKYSDSDFVQLMTNVFDFMLD